MWEGIPHVEHRIVGTWSVRPFLHMAQWFVVLAIMEGPVFGRGGGEGGI